MLSYRHAYHAGSLADVLKHALFAFVLDHAVAKPAPIYVLDTHAGAGGYDLAGAMAEKTGEAQQGIMRLQEATEPPPALLAPYLATVARFRAEAGATTYPGSPELARLLLRPTDRLELVELHGTDHAALAERYRRTANIRVRRDDGLKLLVARLPPPQRRGLALVDPSYEIKTDYETVGDALVRACRRFANGTYLLWYPVIHRPTTEAMLGRIAASGIRRQYRIELAMVPDGSRRGMTASGLLLVNPPWTLPAAASAGLGWLGRALGAEGGASARWIVPE